MKRYITIMMGFVAAIGLADSVYLTLVHYQLLAHKATTLACNLSSGSCVSVLQSPYASLFGVPNAELGIAYFSIVLGAVIIRILTGRWLKPWIFLGLLTVGLAYSLFLLYDLFFVLGIPCPYCILAHTANGLMFVLYALTRPLELNFGFRLRSAS